LFSVKNFTTFDRPNIFLLTVKTVFLNNISLSTELFNPYDICVKLYKLTQLKT